MIEARQLTKRFGGETAIDGVSLRVERGEVVGFLGPNGAGKTTTLRILAGVFPPTAGQAVVDGHDVVREPLAARRSVGYAPERPALHLEMTVRGMVEFAAAMKDVPHRRRAADSALERSGLGGVRERRIGMLSKGFRQRLGLALALVGDPPVLLLDEPAAGLDPEQSAETRRLIRALGASHAVLVSSHALADVEATCDGVVILHRGRVLSAEPPARLAAWLRPASRVDVEAAAPAAALAAALGTVSGVHRVDLVGQSNGHARCRVEVDPGRDVRADIAARVTASGWGLLLLSPVETSLEEAFLALVGSEDAAAARESRHAVGPGASEARSAAPPPEHCTGPQKSEETDRESGHAARGGSRAGVGSGASEARSPAPPPEHCTGPRKSEEADRESGHAGRRGPGASEARSAAQPREHWTGPRKDEEADRESGHAARGGSRAGVGSGASEARSAAQPREHWTGPRKN